MRHFTLLVFLFISVSLSAQIQKGDRLLRLEGIATPGVTASAGTFANVGYFLSEEVGSIGFSTSYGFALSNRFVLGARVGALQELGWGKYFGSRNEKYVRINPYARYYALNRPDLMVFGEVATGVGVFGDDFFDRADDFRGGVGVALPVARGVLATPMVNYNMGKGQNSLDLQLHLEIVLGRNTRGEAVPVASFTKGDVMLGGQFAGVSLVKGGVSGGLSVGGSYFVTGRFAVGTSIDLSGSTSDDTFLGQPISDFRITSLQSGLRVGARYYLTTGRRLVYFAEAGVGYQWSTFRIRSGGMDDKQNGHAATLSAGFGAQYFLRDNFALEVGPSFYRSLSANRDFSRLALNVGGQFFLGR